jgi:hypothetical protein
MRPTACSGSSLCSAQGPTTEAGVFPAGRRIQGDWGNRAPASYEKNVQSMSASKASNPKLEWRRRLFGRISPNGTATFCWFGGYNRLEPQQLVFSGVSPEGRVRETSMRTVMAFPRCALAGRLLGSAALLCSSALFCTPALQAQEVAPSVRIVNRIDERNLVTLKGNTTRRPKRRMIAGQ